MVGSSIQRLLSKDSENLLITVNKADLDLRNQKLVNEFFLDHRFDQVYLAAAKVGGIVANNTYPADFISDNLTIQSNIITSSYYSEVKQLLFLGSSCIYPKDSQQPIPESALLTGELEKTNEAYAIAKIAGIKMCYFFNKQYNRDFRAVMPTNLYGPNDNFDEINSHVIPALIRKFHEAKVSNQESVEVWGSGSPFREFLYVDDLAEACKFVMGIEKSTLDEKNHEYNSSHLNIGYGEEINISTLASLISDEVGFNGKIVFNTNYPDGTFRKLLDSSKINSFGWKPKFSLRKGLNLTYSFFKNNYQDIA